MSFARACLIAICLGAALLVNAAVPPSPIILQLPNNTTALQVQKLNDFITILAVDAGITNARTYHHGNILYGQFVQWDGRDQVKIFLPFADENSSAKMNLLRSIEALSTLANAPRRAVVEGKLLGIKDIEPTFLDLNHIVDQIVRMTLINPDYGHIPSSLSGLNTGGGIEGSPQRVNKLLLSELRFRYFGDRLSENLLSLYKLDLPPERTELIARYLSSPQIFNYYIEFMPAHFSKAHPNQLIEEIIYKPQLGEYNALLSWVYSQEHSAPDWRIGLERLVKDLVKLPSSMREITAGWETPKRELLRTLVTRVFGAKHGYHFADAAVHLVKNLQLKKDYDKSDPYSLRPTEDEEWVLNLMTQVLFVRNPYDIRPEMEVVAQALIEEHTRLGNLAGGFIAPCFALLKTPSEVLKSAFSSPTVK